MRQIRLSCWAQPAAILNIETYPTGQVLPCLGAALSVRPTYYACLAVLALGSWQLGILGQSKSAQINGTEAHSLNNLYLSAAPADSLQNVSWMNLKSSAAGSHFMDKCCGAILDSSFSSR